MIRLLIFAGVLVYGFKLVTGRWPWEPKLSTRSQAVFKARRLLGVEAKASREDIIAAVGAANTGDGVVILTDMFGGTPSNLAISVMKTVGAEVIAGVNLPMLVKLARVRGDLEIKQAVTLAAEAGRKYINVASESLGG